MHLCTRACERALEPRTPPPLLTHPLARSTYMSRMWSRSVQAERTVAVARSVQRKAWLAPGEARRRVVDLWQQPLLRRHCAVVAEEHRTVLRHAAEVLWVGDSACSAFNAFIGSEPVFVRSSSSNSSSSSSSSHGVSSQQSRRGWRMIWQRARQSTNHRFGSQTPVCARRR